MTFLVTFQRELSCGILDNSETLVVAGVLNILFFFFVFYKTVRAARLAAKGQLHKKEAMVRTLAAQASPLLPVCECCVALVGRSGVQGAPGVLTGVCMLRCWRQVLPVYDTYLKALCIALVLRSVLFLFFPGQSKWFSTFHSVSCALYCWAPSEAVVLAAPAACRVWHVGALCVTLCKCAVPPSACRFFRMGHCEPPGGRHA